MKYFTIFVFAERKVNLSVPHDNFITFVCRLHENVAPILEQILYFLMVSFSVKSLHSTNAQFL